MNDFVIVNSKGVLLSSGRTNVRFVKDDVLQLAKTLYVVTLISITMSEGSGSWTFTYVVEPK